MHPISYSQKCFKANVLSFIKCKVDFESNMTEERNLVNTYQCTLLTLAVFFMLNLR